MGAVSPEWQALYRRAEAEALKLLKPGDRLRVKRCGGSVVTVTMTGWWRPTDGHWITSKTLDDIHPICVVKVNGQPVPWPTELEE